MNNRFVIITMQRSGSTMLRSMLDNHPEIRCYGELMKDISEPLAKRVYGNLHYLYSRFHDSSVRGSTKSDFNIFATRGKHGKLKKLLNEVDPIFSDSQIRFERPFEFVNAVFSIEKQKKIKGFKLHIEQHPRFLNDLIQGPSFRIILLERENILAQYSSRLIAKMAGKHHIRGSKAAPDIKVKFNRKSFLKYKDRIENDYRDVKMLLDKYQRGYFHIKYTDLTNYEKIDNLLNFIGASSCENIHPVTRKWNTSQIINRFINPDDVRKTLSQINKSEWIYEDMSTCSSERGVSA